MLKTILSIKNIQEAYFDLVENFDTVSKSSRYTGIDGVKLDDINPTSKKYLEEIRKELKNLTPLTPVIEHEIPKKNGKMRKIFIYTLKDRIKAQSIHRVIEPIMEKLYSPFLFSYRSTHPSYYAAKTISKRYKKYYGEDTVFRGDITEYTENIDKEILIKKLLETDIDKEVIPLLELFIHNTLIRNNEVIKLEKGVIQGVPLMAIFANLYLNNMDLVIGKKIDLYRRVGDDFICFDKNEEKIKEIKEFVIKKTKKIKLPLQLQKTQFIKSNESFDFLGYKFNDKKVSIQSGSVVKFLIKIKRKLRYFPIDANKKLKRLPFILYKDIDSVSNIYLEFIRSYKQASNFEQIEEISEKCFHILVKYFFKTYSFKNHKLCIQLTRKIKIPSLYIYFKKFHNGKLSLSELALSKKKLY